MIRMNNERFGVPELLFRPSDVGIQEMGLSEAIMHCTTLVETGKVDLSLFDGWTSSMLCFDPFVLSFNPFY